MSELKERSNWIWPVIILISAICACIAVYADISSPIRSLFVLWFLVVCPGMAYVRLLDIEDSLTEWILAVALSLAIATAVSLIVLYTKQWSSNWVFSVLAAITFGGVALQLWRIRSSAVFQMKLLSPYMALEEGDNHPYQLMSNPAKRLPQTGICHFSLIAAKWSQLNVENMDELHNIYFPEQPADDNSINAGDKYSLLIWVPEIQSSWSFPVSIQRIPSDESLKTVGIEQVKSLNESRRSNKEALDIIVTDKKYGNAAFLRPLQDQCNGVVVRLSDVRVLYRTPEKPTVKKRGNPRVHGGRFAFKEPASWHDPDDVVYQVNDRWGDVRLQRWNGLHGKLDADVPFDVVHANVHLERDTPPKPIWLAWQAPAVIPDNIRVDTVAIWQAYCHRLPVEGKIDVREQSWGWRKPQLRETDSRDFRGDLAHSQPQTVEKSLQAVESRSKPDS